MRDTNAADGATDGAGVEALTPLATGRLTGWRGLPPMVQRLQVEMVFGPPVGPEGPVLFGGSPLHVVRYGGTSGAPNGTVVWYDGDVLEIVEIAGPHLEASLEDALGPPEAELDSGIGTSRVQLVWASRGLTAHVTAATGDVARLYAFPAVPLEDFLESPLRRVREERIRR